MILPDTSVWIEHFDRGNRLLDLHLRSDQILIHSFVIGELALGNLHRRRTTIADLRSLRHVPVATSDEILAFIDHHQLHGVGMGYVDVHLLAATSLSEGALLWTRDKRLNALASRLHLAWQP